MFASYPGLSFWEQCFRNAGLGIVNHLIYWVRRKHSHKEEKKVAIDKSRRLALARCSVHLLPILISALILVVNFKQVFIGIDFNSLIRSETINIALLQTAAKIQELLIVASLATVTFQLLRYELVCGDGLPLGLLTAGFDFTSLSYFWSPEMLGSLRNTYARGWRPRRIALILFLVTVGTLATLAGPSCAVLLIPQKQDWAAGGTTFYMNGTPDHIWSATLSADLMNMKDICISEDATSYGVCPSGGYNSIWAHYARTNPWTYRNAVPNYARELSGNNYYWVLQSSPPVQIRTISLGLFDAHQTTFIQPHLGVAIILDRLTQDWWQSLKSKRGLTDTNVEDRATVARVLSAMTNVRCSAPQNISSSDRIVLFPDSQDPKLSTKHNLSSHYFNNQPSTHLQFSWVPLPEQAKSTSTGAVFQSAWMADNQSRVVIGCTVQAQWVPAQIHTDAYSFWQGWYPKNITWAEAYPSAGIAYLDGSSASNNSEAIVVDESWLAMLTPPIAEGGPGYQKWRPTTIEGILGSAHLTDDISSSGGHPPIDIWEEEGHNRTGLLMSVIGSVFNDGLARVGIETAFDQNGPPSNWTLSDLVRRSSAVVDKVPTEIQVEFSISGFSYQLTITQKLAMAALLLHILIALLHMVWVFWRRESSGCWDSITELVVLAQNSRPAFSALQNTAAGIKHSSTFAQQVVIRPTKICDDDADADHLEMIYQEETGYTEGTSRSHGAPEPAAGELPEITPPPDSTEMLDFAAHHDDESHRERSKRALHVSTWPVRRLHSQSSLGGSLGQISNPESERLPNPDSDPATPLINAAEIRIPETHVAARVIVGHAYG